VLDTLTTLRGGTPPPPAKSAAPSRPARTAPKEAGPVAKPASKPTAKAPEPTPSAPTPKAAASPAPAAPTPKAPEAPVSAPEPPPAPASPAVPAGDFWPAFINTVRSQRPLIAGWVTSGVLLGIEGDMVRIGFPPEQEFSKDALEKGHMALLEDAARGILGRRVTIKMALKDGLVAAPPVPVAPPRDPMEEFKADPLIKKALEIFKAEIQPA
jgi:hypothetical protein